MTAPTTTKPTTSRGYLRNPGNYGYQHPGRYKSIHGKGIGSLKYHAIGCRVDGGGGLAIGACEKCMEDIGTAYVRLLMRVDNRDQR